MTGWWFGVFRLTDGGAVPATPTSELGVRVAEWQSGSNGKRWLDHLSEAGKVIDLGGDGYPYRYTIQAGVLAPYFTGGIPEVRERWAVDPGDIVTKEWKGKTTIREHVLNECRLGEWLMIEAWDEG